MLDVAADDGLFIGNNDQCFQGRFAEAQGLGLNELFDPVRVLGTGPDLITAGDLVKVKPAPPGFIFRG